MIEVFNNMKYTEIATLFKERAEETFKGYPEALIVEAWKVMFEQYRLDERTQMIQSFKTQNISAIHNGR